MNPFRNDPRNYQPEPIRAEAPTTREPGEGIVGLRLYDPIDSFGGPWGVSAKEFVSVLDGLPKGTTEIRLAINSPGGEVWEGLAIMNALRAHPARVVAVVEGVAASSASFIAAGADELHMMPNSELFLHKAWGLGIGNADDLTKLAGDLTHEDRNLASIYATKAGGDAEEWLATMAAETWLSAEEAVAAGLADKVLPVKDDAADGKAVARARFDMSWFAHAEDRDLTPKPGRDYAKGGTLQPGAVITTNTTGVQEFTLNPGQALSGVTWTTTATNPVAASAHRCTPLCVTRKCAGPTDTLPAGQGNTEKGADMPDMAKLREALGLTPDASDEATQEALAGLVQTSPAASADGPKVDATPDTDKVVIVSRSAWEDQQRTIADLSSFVDKSKRDERDVILDQAVRDGKFRPSQLKDFADMWDSNPEATRNLVERMIPNSALAVQAFGYAADLEDESFEAEFAGLFPPSGKGR